MNLDSFLTSPRWEILQIIAKKPESPMEIAEKLNTTVSYVSQQLKLLEAAGLVKKERTGAVERGKPRTLFSISNEFLYLITLTKKFSGKKLIYLTEHHKTILKIWLIDDPSLHYYIEKFFWQIENSLNEIDAIFIDTSKPKPTIIIVSESKKLKQKISFFIKEFSEKIDYSIISKKDLKKTLPTSAYSLYDSDNILKELKGGENTNEKAE
jgi:predicted transcriptional regulator